MPPTTQSGKLTDYRGLAYPTFFRRSALQVGGNPFGGVIFLVETFKDLCLQLETLYDASTMAIVCWTVAFGRRPSNLYIKKFGSRSFTGIHNSIHTFLLPFPILHFAAELPYILFSIYPLSSCAVYVSKSFRPIYDPRIYRLSS